MVKTVVPLCSLFRPTIGAWRLTRCVFCKLGTTFTFLSLSSFAETPLAERASLLHYLFIYLFVLGVDSCPVVEGG